MIFSRERARRGFAAFLLTAALTGASAVALAEPARAADESIAVDFSAGGGTPAYRASGWIYGMTENASAPADHFYRDVKFQAMRAGGAQLDSPGGWVSGRYDRRWNATRAQLLRTRALGGRFVLLVHDLWGADGYPISRFPGDNGDWTDYDNFLTRLIGDVRATGAPVEWDLWNEPNISLFWNRPQSQYFALWQRAYQRIRAAFPAQPIIGPSLAGVPSTSAGWWTQYLDFVRSANVVPDIVSWHSLPGDPVANVAAANASLDARGIPHPRPYQINEYGASNEQNPGDGSWYITRLERAGADGLRANWASGGNLHNDLGNLLVHDSAGQHQPKGEWWVYRFYGSQTGRIAATTPSGSYDAFATATSGTAKVLLGGGGTTGNVAVALRRLDATTGIVQNNQVRVLVQRIPYNGGGAVAGPVTVQNSVLTLSGNAVTVNVPHTNADDTFTLTLLPPSDGGFPSVAVAQHSQQCLDNTGLSTADGNRQQQFPCEGGDQQLWNFRPVSGAFTVVNQQSGKCLEVAGASTADGAAVQQGTCSPGAANQQFTLRKVTYGGNDSHDYQLAARHSGKCVDVNQASTAARAQLIQWTCRAVTQGSPLNQTWRLWGSGPG
ncbi:RICIN domain-containing protein [Amycolatopsis sp. FBCC-B4732]|uniref:RICIN domain-containing protein n=1 Tax=Amycolatopsis sp. FBCC-B4732 TaxID=3079339 RepID=UPI001FF21481|nr:RICIN domain-containing protein [Amycolatopsis sp. FBCC-B4732]UOX90726.1 RICIN domain-containing protein [Amycolatopsis sp. FBCC-B4732]